MENEPQIEEFKNNQPGNQELLERTRKSIYSISSENTEMAFAFFCGLPFLPNKSLLHLLIIKNNFIREEDTLLGKEIKINVNNVKKVLKIDKSRKIYRENKKDGITIIEIKPSDNIDLNSCLEIEYNNIQDNSEKKYTNKIVYLIKYPYEKKTRIIYKKNYKCKF